jgi:hypothetical protein
MNWSDVLTQILGSYDEALLRQVASRLFKPRNQWPVEELIDRCVATVNNAAVIDRRLHDLGMGEQRLLALIGHSRQPRWKLVHLLEMLAALGHTEGVQPVLHLFQAGLLFPDRPARAPRLKNVEQWLGQASATEFGVFAHPLVTERALGIDLGLPDLGGVPLPGAAVHEADGLEWLLRLAVLWQQAASNPFRRTQTEDFFKRDLDRLRSDPLLNSVPPDHLAALPDPGLLAVALGVREGILVDQDDSLQAGTLPSAWSEGLVAALASLWTALPFLQAWDPQRGWGSGLSSAANPYPSVYLLCLLLLARLPEDRWVHPAVVEQWVFDQHPFWSRGSRSDERPRSPERGAGSDRDGGQTSPAPRSADSRPAVSIFLLGLAYQLRLLQAARNAEGAWLVRLAPLGRYLIGTGPVPPVPPAFPQTLLVQPNLEILAYRQGLNPELIAALSRFAAWKSLGAACTLQLQPDTVYRALESGETFESILQTLQRHGMKATPAPVVDSLKTWANKRERISVYPSAVLLEFTSPDHLSEALARGLPGVPLSDRLAVVAHEGDVNYQLFRLTGTRDYALPPEKCVEVEADGVTLTIDLARSDLLLETEVQRFAEPVSANSSPNARMGIELANGRRQYRLTPASLAAGRESGLSLTNLEGWFVQRTGQALTPAARLLLTGCEFPPLELRRLCVLSVPTRELADGLVQWPASRSLILERLGPTALVVAEENAAVLRERMQALGVKVQEAG